MGKLFTGQVFGKQELAEHPLAIGEFENCTFRNADFAESDLSGFIFAECEFLDCNISLAKLTKQPSAM